MWNSSDTGCGDSWEGNKLISDRLITKSATMNLMPLNEALVHLDQQYLPVTPNNSFLHDTCTCKERVMNFVKHESAFVNIRMLHE